MTLFADNGFWGKQYDQSMRLIDIELVCPERHRLGQRPPIEIAKAPSA